MATQVNHHSKTCTRVGEVALPVQVLSANLADLRWTSGTHMKEGEGEFLQIFLTSTLALQHTGMQIM